MNLDLTLDEIAAIVGATGRRGASTRRITGIAALTAAAPGDLSFLGNVKYRAEVAPTRATAVLLPADFPGEPAEEQVFLLVENPSVALARLCARIEQRLWPKVAPGVHPSAVVATDVVVPASATIGPLCVVESGAIIGDGCRLDAGVVVGRAARLGRDCWLMARSHVATECELGDRVRLQPGVVIGSDGFGYEVVAGRHEKVPQVGNVVIGSDVEIGANSTIDRARFSRTEVGEGTKIDNLVQIGHNVRIGRHCILCAQVGIAGSTTLGDYVVLGGQVGVAGHLTLGNAVKVGAQSGLGADAEDGAYLNGSPALPLQLERRLLVLTRRLPDLFRRVDSLAAELKKMASA